MSKENHKHMQSGHLAGILTCLALFCFCFVMLYIGFVSVDIECARKHTGEPPVCMIQEQRLLGLFNSRVSVSSVSNVSYQTRHSQARGRLASGSTAGPGLLACWKIFEVGLKILLWSSHGLPAWT